MRRNRAHTFSVPDTDASDAIQEQHAAILKAIAYLQNDLNTMTSEISPETSSWRDVSRFAHTADMAHGIIARYEEQ